MKRKTIKKWVRTLHIAPSTDMYERTLRDSLQAQQDSKRTRSTGYRPSLWRAVIASKVGALAVILLVATSWTMVLLQWRQVRTLRIANDAIQPESPLSLTEDTATINLYIEEHQDVIAQHASRTSAPPAAPQLRVGRDDILYYELVDEDPGYVRPGLILRGPSSRHEISPADAPAISSGETLSLAEARASADFDLISPSWLAPYYTLHQVRKVEDRDTFQLLYTDGFHSTSLFEQPLNGRHGLEPQDFREYVVYRNDGQAGGAILTWRDEVRLYVLVGNAEVSQLMDMAQSINAVR
jgi:hypothetical protein